MFTLNISYAVISNCLYIKYFDVILLFFISLSFWLLCFSSSFRHKLCYFIIVLLFLSAWGFYASFDGLILMMIAVELGVISILLLVFISSKFILEAVKFSKYWIYLYFFCIFGIYLFAIPFSSSQLYYLYDFLYVYCMGIISKDLKLLFCFITELSPLVAVYLSCILGLFSVFFVCVYFLLKLLSNASVVKHEEKVILRKQIFNHQLRFKPQLKTFQK